MQTEPTAKPAATTEPTQPQPTAQTPPVAQSTPPAADADEFAEYDAALQRQLSPSGNPPKEKADESKEEPEPEAKTETKPEAKTEPKKIETPKGLRDALEKAKSDLKAAEERAAKLEAKSKELADAPKNIKALSDKLAEKDKEIENLSSQIRALRQEESPEFKQKHEKPFMDAASTAREDIEQLVVADESGENRKATWDDFISIFNLPYQKALETAENMFGKGERLVMSHYQRLHELQRARNAALKEERENWKKNDEARQAEMVAAAERRKETIAALEKETLEKTEHYRDNTDDKELSEIRKKGYTLFDTKPASEKQHLLRLIHARHRFAAYGPLVVSNNRLKAENEKLKSQLEEMKSSSPTGKTQRATTPPSSGDDDSFVDGLRKALQ